jgi:hypothetical protein
MPATKPVPVTAPLPVLPTGKNHIMGRFCVKLNLSPQRLGELEEEFHLLFTLAPLNPEKPVLISDFTELQPSEWIRAEGSKHALDKFPFRVPLAFKKDRKGEGYAECELLCWAFHPDHASKRFLTLAYDRKDARGLGYVVFRDVPWSGVRGWSLKVREEEGKLASKEKRTARTLLSPSAWQPEAAFGGAADVHLWRLPDPLPLVDGHLHIQSNHCAPLPLVWDKLPVKNVFEFLRIGWDARMPDRKALTDGIVAGAVGGLILGAPGAVFALGGMIANQIRIGNFRPGLDGISGLLFGESGKIGGFPTEFIGGKLASQLEKAPTWTLPFFSAGGPHAMATPLPMDMHYGHFHGYHGEPIYKMVKEVFTFRLNPFSDTRGNISGPDTKAYEDYDNQMLQTSKVAKDKAWRMLPLFHYDPRRWMEKSEVPETWDKPFVAVNTAKGPSPKKMPFIGFKTYTSLGYMPLDPALPHQADFYGKCAADGIPIMNHCTTAGMYTHDKPFFYDLWRSDPALKAKLVPDADIEALDKELRAHIKSLRFGIVDHAWKNMEKKLLRLKIAWFDRNYVFPSAWEPVAARWPGLKVCLAHFCGYDFFGEKEFKNGETDKDTGMIYGFPETDPGGLPDAGKTNPLIQGLCKLVRPDNQIHFDVSFFFVTDHNKDAVRNFYHWARAYKGGFILDRMLWGSDWPLLATDLDNGKRLKNDQLKGYVDMNAREWMELDPELWFRMAVVNPVRFYNLKDLRPHLESIFGKPAPAAYLEPALTMAEIYANRGQVSG